MAVSKRNLATLVGALAFALALLIYFATRPNDPAPPRTAGHDNSESVNQGRSLGQKLAALLKTPPAPTATSEMPSHAAGPVCDKCTTENCAPGTDDGCDSILDAGDRKLCEELYACFSDPRNNCAVKGDPIPCWCGTNMLTCVTDNSGPSQANGPCVKQVFAAAKSNEADTIFRQFLSVDLPLGRAARLSVCRGSFCANDCTVR
jgi:hypothetical protein